MVEKKGLGRALSHAVLLFGAAIVLFPLYVALVATSHSYDVLIGTTPLWFGQELIKNFTTVLTQGLRRHSRVGHDGQQPHHGARHRPRQDRHFHHCGLRHRVLPLPRT